MIITDCYQSGWLSVRLHHVHLHLNEYREPFKGTVRTPTVASGHEYCLQTAHLESSASAVSLETRPTFQTMGCGKDGSPVYLNPTICWRDLNIQFPGFVGPRDHQETQLCYVGLYSPTIALYSSTEQSGVSWWCGSSQILGNKPRLVAPFYDGYGII